MKNLRVSEASFRHRIWGHKINKEIGQKNIKEYLSLASALSTQASFPDSGYYYAQKERQFDRLGKWIERHIPKRKQILIQMQVYRIFEQGMKYYEPSIKCRDGSFISPYEMDAKMAFS